MVETKKTPEAGLEPAATGLKVQRSNQLSYPGSNQGPRKSSLTPSKCKHRRERPGSTVLTPHPSELGVLQLQDLQARGRVRRTPRLHGREGPPRVQFGTGEPQEHRRGMIARTASPLRRGPGDGEPHDGGHGPAVRGRRQPPRGHRRPLAADGARRLALSSSRSTATKAKAESDMALRKRTA